MALFSNRSGILFSAKTLSQEKRLLWKATEMVIITICSHKQLHEGLSTVLWTYMKRPLQQSRKKCVDCIKRRRITPFCFSLKVVVKNFFWCCTPLKWIRKLSFSHSSFDMQRLLTLSRKIDVAKLGYIVSVFFWRRQISATSEDSFLCKPFCLV